MNNTKQLKQSVLEAITPSFLDCILCEEYNEETLYQAQKNAVVCMTLNEISTENGVFENLMECEQSPLLTKLVHGAPAKVTFDFFLYAKPNKKEFFCDELFDRLADCLLFQSKLKVKQISRGKLCFKPEYDRYELKATAVLEVVLTKESTQTPIQSAKVTVAMVTTEGEKI